MRRAVLLLLVGCAVRSAAAQPPLSFVPESAFIPTPRLVQLSTYNVTEPALGSLVVFADNYGCVGDGVAVDDACITNAVAATPSGWTLKFTAGKTYRKTSTITVSAANVTLWGYGAVIFADANGSGTPGLAFKLTGAGDNAFGMTILSNLSQRVSNTDSAAIWLFGDSQSVIDGRFEYTGLCVAIQATHAFVGRNICYRDWADGLSAFGGSTCNNFPPSCFISNIIIAGNIVRQNGDDSISIVNYADSDGQDSFLVNVLVEYNDLADSYGGACLSDHGASNVTFRYNRCGPDPCVTGIQIDSQVSFLTRNVRNILVDSNDVSDVQTTSPPYLPAGHTCSLVDHGGFYLNVAGQSGVSHVMDSVLFTHNKLTRAARRGAQLQETGTPAGLATNVGFQGQRFSGVQETTMSVPAGTSVCVDNQVSDLIGLVVANCTAAAMPSVTGSSYVSR